MEAWKSCGIEISHWVVSKEGHAVTDDGEMNMFHYDMALKLAKRGRWLQVRRFLDKTFSIQVHFSDGHNTYYSAYKYLTKDTKCLYSEPHPNLSSPPKTEWALASKKRKAREKNTCSQRKARKQRGLTVYEVTQLILAKKITTRLELVCLSVEQSREGKCELAEFIANRRNKVEDALDVAKEFGEAEAKLLSSKKSRIQLLQEAKEGNCSCEGREGAWLEVAIQTLRNNGISIKAFCTAVYIALKKGRGKYQNIFIHGPANSGKTFIIKPLKVIYHTFCNPATGTFAWLGAEQAHT